MKLECTAQQDYFLKIEFDMYIAIDIGGTNVRVASAQSLDNLVIISRAVFKNDHNFDDYISKVISFVKKQDKVGGIGISITGDLNEEKTMAIDTSPNAPEFLNQPIVDIFKKEFRCPVFLENDGPASALGEALYGKERNKNFAYIIWGTGIGGAQISWDNNKTKVEQLGWYKYFEEWENQCGGNRIKEKFEKPAGDLNNTEWNEVMKIFKGQLLEFLSKIKPSLIVFGGGISINQKKRLVALKKELSSSLPEIQTTSLGDDTGLYGAFALIKNGE